MTITRVVTLTVVVLMFKHGRAAAGSTGEGLEAPML